MFESRTRLASLKLRSDSKFVHAEDLDLDHRKFIFCTMLE